MTDRKKSDDVWDGTKRRDPTNDLDCIFCGRWFPTFDRLAKHTYARHGPPTPGNDAKPASHEVESPMAKKRTAPKPRSGGALPKPQQNESANDFNPFLKAKDIGKKGALLRLTNAPHRIVDGNYGEQLIVEVEYKRHTYDWGINTDSPNYRMLYERFGANPKKWRGDVQVFAKESTNGNLYIAVAREQ